MLEKEGKEPTDQSFIIIVRMEKDQEVNMQLDSERKRRNGRVNTAEDKTNE